VTGQVPQQYKTLGLANLIGGLINVFIGGFVASTVWSTVGGLCTGICTFGLCPFGVFMGLFGFLVVPLGMAEAALGLVTLLSPEATRPLWRILPYGQCVAVLLGDFVSPILGIVGMMMTRDPEVAAYIEGI
jgi:hypothetical protein